MNLFYKCVSFLPVKLILVAMKEVVRVRKISAGVHHAHHLYHHGWFVMMATGWLKGDTWDAPEPAGRAGTVWAWQAGMWVVFLGCPDVGRNEESESVFLEG